MFSKLAMFTISNNLAVPVYVAPEDIHLGQSVFQYFVHEEFVHEGVPEDDVLANSDEPNANEIVDENFAYAHNLILEGIGPGEISTPIGYRSSPKLSQIGGTIRELANEFGRSRQRRDIRHLADEVDLAALNREQFWSELEEVFSQGITKENLIALFFFCSDVLIRCVKSKLREIGLNLFRWSLNYIAERVVRWVNENGGWESALRKAYDSSKKFIIIGAASFVSIVAIAYFYARK